MESAVLPPEGLFSPCRDVRIDRQRPDARVAAGQTQGRRITRRRRIRTASSSGHPHRLRWLAIALLFCAGGLFRMESAHATPATVLLAKYAELSGKLQDNAFQKPLYIDSTEHDGQVRGNLYALIQEPFTTVQSALKEPGHWCDILILHLNTKYCRAFAQGSWTALKVNIGRKAEQPIAQSHRVEFDYRVIAAAPDHLAVVLDAAKGPFGTRDYSILFEAVPLQRGQTFLHLAYSYAYGTAAKLAMHAYLASAGRKKVGFTVIGRHDDGEVEYIDGLRGLVERNTMRYYLAIESYLGALSSPPAAQLEKRLRDWYAAAERYPRQLHEIELNAYLAMKRQEYLRQQIEP